MKKLTALLLALLLVVTSAVAFAAVPSKVTTDLVAITDPTGIFEVGEESPIVTAQLADIGAVVEEGKTPAEAFGDDTQAALAELGMDGAEMNEFIPLKLNGLENFEGDEITITIAFATPYTQDQKVAGVFTMFDENNEKEEAVVPGVVNEDGSVSFTLKRALVEKLVAAAAVTLAVFSK